MQSQLDCLVFENKNGNDSGSYFYPLRFEHAKAVKLDKIKQKKEKQRRNRHTKKLSVTLLYKLHDIIDRDYERIRIFKTTIDHFMILR